MEIILETGKETLTLEVERYQPQSDTYVCSIVEDDNGDCDWLIVDACDLKIRHGDFIGIYTDTADWISGANFCRPVINDPKKTFNVSFEGTKYRDISKALKNMQASDKNFSSFEDVFTHYKFAGWNGVKDGRTRRRAKQQTLSVATRFNRRFDGKLSNQLVESGVPATALPESLKTS